MEKFANVPISGYLYSMGLKHPGARKKDKLWWQINVCAAIPDDRIYPRGSAAQWRASVQMRKMNYPLIK